VTARAVRIGNFAAGAALFLAAAAARAETAAPAADTVRYPYVAALSRSSDGERVYFCAGALVAPRWILTAAHCFFNPRGGRIGSAGVAAEVGASRLGEVPAGAQVRVARILVHPDFDPQSQDNDIALFPGESQTLTVTWNSADLRGATPVVSVSGWNVPTIDISA